MTSFHAGNRVEVLPDNALGYGTARNAIYDCLVDYGLTENPESKVAVHCSPAPVHNPTPGKINILYTMCENDRIEQKHIDGLNRPDVVVVPTKFCADVFRPHTTKPLYIVPLGVDIDKFAYIERPKKPKTMQFLWVGAANYRKGYDIISRVWTEGFYRIPNVRLYMKTWNAEHKGIEERGNVTVDGRFLSTDEMVKLYHDSHVFLYPTAGEGWGLGLSEAMATGLPCVATRYSGLLDFTNRDTVLYLDFEMVESLLVDGSPAGKIAYANPAQLAAHITYCIFRYNRALKMGKQASRKMRDFTWKRTGRELAEIIEKYSRTP